MSQELLWIDDDEPERFVYEQRRLRQEGWRTTWARSVEHACERLAHQPFDSILLDQMVAPDGALGHLMMWSGCRLLYWLRQSATTPPWPQEDRSWSILAQRVPLERNRTCPVTLVSAYRNVALLEATRRAGSQDASIKILAKPFDVDALLAHLQAQR